MSPSKKQRRWSEIEAGPHACHRQERVNIGLSRRRQTHDFCIHQLLPSKASLPENPPESRVEPEQGPGNLLEQSYQPVVPANMREFMTRNGALRLSIERNETGGNQDDGSENTQRDRPHATPGHAERGARISQS